MTMTVTCESNLRDVSRVQNIQNFKPSVNRNCLTWVFQLFDLTYSLQKWFRYIHTLTTSQTFTQNKLSFIELTPSSPIFYNCPEYNTCMKEFKLIENDRSYHFTTCDIQLILRNLRDTPKTPNPQNSNSVPYNVCMCVCRYLWMCVCDYLQVFVMFTIQYSSLPNW